VRRNDNAQKRPRLRSVGQGKFASKKLKNLKEKDRTLTDRDNKKVDGLKFEINA
jgi:hypothetical protein